MNSITLKAYAKVNLFLKVLDKRPDGYHDIVTLFERISLCDTVTVAKSPRGVTVVSDKPITGNPRDNIAYKAAKLMLRRFKIHGGVRIRIVKRIPMAAGLGGGSSDAAAVLVAIVRLYNINISLKTLIGIGAGLGSDVPFFLLNSTFAVGKGRGEKLKKADIGIRPWHLLIYPGDFKRSTGDIYMDFDVQAARKKSPSNYLTSRAGDVRIRLPKDWKGLESLLHNDLGDVVAKTRPVIGNTIQCLVASLSKKLIVSGSGPSLFCLYRTRKEALAARRRLLGSVPAGTRERWQIFAVRAM